MSNEPETSAFVVAFAAAFATFGIYETKANTWNYKTRCQMVLFCFRLSHISFGLWGLLNFTWRPQRPFNSLHSKVKISKKSIFQKIDWPSWWCNTFAKKASVAFMALHLQRSPIFFGLSLTFTSCSDRGSLSHSCDGHGLAQDDNRLSAYDKS